jgi:tetratricopeptide (TPR) repeat protein
MILTMALLCAVGAGPLTAAAPERADWWSVEQSVGQELLTRDVGQYARELNEQRAPTTDGDLMRRFSVLNRAGHLRQVRTVIDAMSDAKLETHQLSHMADFLIGRRDWPTARYFLERLPQAQPGWGYVLIKEWASTGDANVIDAWLVERAKANPRYWLRERLRFRSDQGTAAELVEELVGQVRKRPQDVEVALQFLEATSVVRESDRDIAWLGDICRPSSAYASYRLGQALRSSPRAAIALLEHSLEMPFTKEDAAMLQTEMSRAARARPEPATPPLEQQIRYATKRELLTALHAAGESARAQKLLEELARLQPDGLPPVGFDALAGQVQAASGARVVQKRFQEAEAEPENQESAEYWQRRARYFTGRKEHAEAIAAYEKALQFSVPDPDPNTARAGGGVLRSSVLGSYVFFLEHAHQEKSAVPLLNQELANAPLEGTYAQRIVDILLKAPLSTLLAVDRERLWAYLAARPQWSYHEERLLWRLAEQPADRREKNWQRAEELARDRHPSRSLVLGWVMTRTAASARAIPWLKGAWQRLEKPEDRQRAAFDLFDAYLDTGDWRSAEELWPTARQRLTPNELPNWLGRIAVTAARAGDQTDALRLWRQRTNLDRARTDQLDEMLRAGLGQPLLAFYRSLAQQDPDCQSLDPAIQSIVSP